MQQRTIGVLSPLFGGFFFGGLLKGIHEEALQAGARVIAVQTLGEDFGLPQQLFSIPLAEAYVDGWIAILDSVDHDHLRTIQASGKPVVALSGVIPEVACAAVRPDNIGGMAQVVDHLIEHGHTRIAFIGSLHQSDIQQRYEGYQQALRQHGIEPDPALFFQTKGNLDYNGAEAGRALLAAGVPCTAIVAATDLNAIGAMSVLQEAGYRVPGDMAVVGFDDSEQAQYALPPLASVRQRFDVLAGAAVRLVLDQLNGERLEPETLYVPTLLVPRGSCGCRTTTHVQQMLDTEEIARDSWRSQLEARLVALLLAPQQPPAGLVPASIWPRIGELSDALDAVLSGDDLPAIGALSPCWQQGIVLNGDQETLSGLLMVLGETGRHQLADSHDDIAAHRRLESFLSLMRMEMMHAWQSIERERRTQLDTYNLVNYRIHLALQQASSEYMRSLSWLHWSSVHAACLGLWTEVDGERRLELAGTFTAQDIALPEQEQLHTIEHFPPAQMLDSILSQHPADVVTLMPVHSSSADWGVVTLIGPLQTAASYGLNYFGQWTAALGSALDREALLQSLSTREAALSALNVALTEAKVAAEESNRLKSEFLAIMSHELRTPLNAILNFTKLMGRDTYGGLSDHQRDFQRRVLSNSEHLLRLISDILDISKIEAGRMELVKRPVELPQLLQEVVGSVLELSREKELQLTLEAAATLPPVLADQMRVRQVVLNLLSNAIKFTSEGKVLVRAYQDQADLVTVAVQDSGIGIAPDHHHMIFETFRQVQSDMAREYQGTGLGLPISKKLVAMHGGTMWLESTEGQGSTFFFTLPVAPALPAAGDPTRAVA